MLLQPLVVDLAVGRSSDGGDHNDIARSLICSEPALHMIAQYSQLRLMTWFGFDDGTDGFTESLVGNSHCHSITD